MNKKTKVINFFVIIGLVLSVSLSACVASSGLERTPFDQLELKNYPSLGCSLLVPKAGRGYIEKVYDSEVFQNNTGRKEVGLKYHPYASGQLFTEPEYLLVFRVVKFNTPVENYPIYKRFKKKDEKFPVILSSKFIDAWIGVDEYSGREYYLLTREIEENDKTMVIAGAKLLRAEHVNPMEKQDIEFVEKVLMSLSCD